jgi:hypothetical protein
MALATFMAREGVPHQFLSDHAKEFRSQTVADLARIFGVKQIFSLKWTPRCNLVERCHSWIHFSLTKCLNDHSEWPLYLPFVESVYNNSLHSSLSFCPNFVYFGRQLRTPVEGILSWPPKNGDTQSPYLSQFIDQLRQIHESARVHLKNAALKNEKAYNTSRSSPQYEIGQQVFVYNARRRKNQFPKWVKYWATRARIVKRVNSMLYVIEYVDRKGRLELVHSDKLKAVPNENQTDQNQ